jgi:hypothetical protein
MDIIYHHSGSQHTDVVLIKQSSNQLNITNKNRKTNRFPLQNSEATE